MKHNTSRAKRLLVVGAIGTCLSVMCASAQNPPAEGKSAADVWLLKDCSVGEQDQLRPVLRKYSTQLESYFLNALRKGPPDQILKEVEAAASTLFDQRQEVLKTGTGLGLSEADLQALRMTTREQYLKQQRDDFVISYQSKAVSGLGVVASDQGRAVLRALAADQSSPLQGVAKNALEQPNYQPEKGKIAYPA